MIFGSGRISIRTFSALAIMGTVCLCSCEAPSPQGVAFEARRQWRPVEKESLSRLPRGFRAHPQPDYRAVWTNGTTRYIYLDEMGIESITAGWTVYVFNEAGDLIEHNSVSAYTGFKPRRVLSISPLRIGFGRPETTSVGEIAELQHTAGEWQEFMKRVQDHTQKTIASQQGAAKSP
jgi:hypothetical protein